MMSRITLHLRKQARDHKIESGCLGFSALRERSRLRFTNSSVADVRHPLPAVNVIVEASSVVHDDHGVILGATDTTSRGPGPSKVPQWYELHDITPPPGDLLLYPPPSHTATR